ncbi:MAG TPA: FtsX-like permease family protein [Steroidobacteraceae bacterium]
MEILSILTGLRRHKTMGALIVVQVALTLCIVSNSLFVIHECLVRIDRPSGLNESDLVLFRNEWIGSPQDRKARLSKDLSMLRSMPGVLHAIATNSISLSIGGSGGPVRLQAGQERPSAFAAHYFVDEHAIQTLGFRMTAGRWFTSEDITDVDTTMVEGPPAPGPPSVIITRRLAERLFPSSSALGKNIFIGTNPSAVVGIVDRLVIPLFYGNSAANLDSIFENSILVPGLLVEDSYYYVIRSKPGEASAVLLASQALLFHSDRMRGIDHAQTFAQIRADSYRADRSLAWLLTIVCALLLIVTGLGIVGLSNYWVRLRRSPIGIRRALGARRIDIVRYFQIENLYMVGAGSAIGAALAVASNLWMVQHLQLSRIGWAYVAMGAALVLGLGQLAVFWPARKAASIPPATATRAV